MSEYHVIIPSAGHGSRMQSAEPKQYLSLRGKPILRHAIDVFESLPQIKSITVVISQQDHYWQPTLLDGCVKTAIVTCGGQTRAETVLNGLNQLNIDASDWVLVHDAARPGIDQDMLLRLFDAVHVTDIGGILALPLADTLKRVDNAGDIAETIPREGLWQAQTPQMFTYAALREALATHLHRQPTDEAQAMEWMGHRPKLILGGLKNLKITYPQDLTIVTALMQVAD